MVWDKDCPLGISNYPNINVSPTPYPPPQEQYKKERKLVFYTADPAGKGTYLKQGTKLEVAHSYPASGPALDPLHTFTFLIITDRYYCHPISRMTEVETPERSDGRPQVP